jgi:hypothetical protein
MINPFPQLLIIVLLAVLLVRGYLNRNMPRVGGKIGRRRAALAAIPVPDGFSRVENREITRFGSRSDGVNYPSLKIYMRDGTFARPALARIYRVAACKTRIEFPAENPDYERIEPAEALALLRELPDPRLVYRLHLSDEPCFLDPWIRQITGREIYHLGNATNTGLVVLYRPDRRLTREIGLTLLHEWLHLVAFQSARSIRRFKRANAIEPLAPMSFAPVSFGDPKTPIYEVWSDLGEKLLGYDDEIARQAALASPVHTMILWRRIEKILRAVPARLRSTRLAEFEARAAFMRTEVAPKARAARATRWRLWPGLRRSH